MGFSSAPILHSIARTWTIGDEENVIPIAVNTKEVALSVYPEMPDHFWVNGHLMELRVTAKLTSLPYAPLPEIDSATDNETSKLVKTMESKWKNPRLEFELWISSTLTSTGEPIWVWAADIALQNPNGYPYQLVDGKRYFTNNLSYDFGGNCRLGLSLKKIMVDGYLYSLQAEDTLTVQGNWRQEIFNYEPPQIIQPTIVSGSVQQIQQRFEEKPFTVGQANRVTIMPVRDSRVNGSVRHSGTTNNLLVKEGGLVSSSDYTHLVSPGQTKSLTTGYNGLVTAIAVGGQVQAVTEETYNVIL